MQNFSEYVAYLTEKVKIDTGQEANKASQTKGTLHELLVGKFLRGGKDMDKHPHVSGLSPREALAEYKARVSPEYYKQVVKRAQAAADHIRSEVEKEFGKGAIKDAHWTSKHGDLHRATGIHATQLEDASDIVLHLKKNKTGKKFVGMSLKAGDVGGPIPSTNPGIESTFGGQKFVDAEHARLDKKYPGFAKQTNKDARQAWIDKQPQRVKDDIYNGQTRVLTQIRDNMHKNLQNLSPEARADWIRHTVLHAVQTPMEKEGVGVQWKHSAIGLEGNYKLRSVRPSEDWEHVFNDPHNITMKPSGGLGLDFHYRDPETGKETKFARHAIKLNSRTGGRSGSVKGSGVEALEYFRKYVDTPEAQAAKASKSRSMKPEFHPLASGNMSPGDPDRQFHGDHELAPTAEPKVPSIRNKIPTLKNKIKVQATRALRNQ